MKTLLEVIKWLWTDVYNCSESDVLRYEGFIICIWRVLKYVCVLKQIILNRYFNFNFVKLILRKTGKM